MIIHYSFSQRRENPKPNAFLLHSIVSLQRKKVAWGFYHISRYVTRIEFLKNLTVRHHCMEDHTGKLCSHCSNKYPDGVEKARAEAGENPLLPAPLCISGSTEHYSSCCEGNNHIVGAQILMFKAGGTSKSKDLIARMKAFEKIAVYSLTI